MTLGKMALGELLAEHVAEGEAPARTSNLIELITPEQLLRLSRLNHEASRPYVKPPRWGSARAAILEYARHVTYGATAKGPSSVHAKMIDMHRGPDSVLAPRDEPVRYDQKGADWIAEVGQAIDAAYVAPWCVHVSPQRVEITAAHCRTILVLRVCGKPVAQKVDRTVGDAPGERAGDTSKAWRHTRLTAWVEQSAAQLADDVSGYVGAEVTVGVIAAVVKHGLRSVTDALSAAGLVPEARRREESDDIMASNDPDRVSGWKDVAAVCGLDDEGTARRWHARYEGMPVRFTPSGRVYASRRELSEWCEKATERIRNLAAKP